MHWIEGISRTTGGFVLDTIAENGDRDRHSLSALSHLDVSDRRSRKRVVTDCRTWTRRSADPFWDRFALHGNQPRDDHGVFQFDVEGQPYLLPVAVLLAAAVRPIRLMQAFLFRPQGLEYFSTPIIENCRPGIELHLPQSQVFGYNNQLPSSLIATYSWMHSFPSARKMWDSVYLAALTGRLDLAPPLATLTMALRSQEWKGFRLITEATIVSVETHEAPFAFAEGHPCRVHFHDSAGVDWATAHHPVNTTPPGPDGWKLTDAEWKLLAAIVKPAPRAKHDLREIINLILEKLATDQPWRALEFGRLNFSIVQGTYRRLKADGRWKELESLLIQCRRSI